MQPERSLGAPLYVPEELQRAYGAEARRRVQESRAATAPSGSGRTASPSGSGRTASPSGSGRTGSPSGSGRTASPSGSGRTASPSSSGRTGSPLWGLRVALVLATVGWGVLVGVWWWLAQRTGSPVWSAVAVLGAIVLALVAVAVPRTWSREPVAADPCPAPAISD